MSEVVVTVQSRIRIVVAENGWVTQHPEADLLGLPSPWPEPVPPVPAPTPVVPRPASPHPVSTGRAASPATNGQPAFPHEHPARDSESGYPDTNAPPGTTPLILCAPPHRFYIHEAAHLTVDSVIDRVTHAFLHVNGIDFEEASRQMALLHDRVAPSLLLLALNEGFLAVSAEPAPVSDAVLSPFPSATVDPPAAPSGHRPLRRMIFPTFERMRDYVREWMFTWMDWMTRFDTDA